MNIPIMKRGKQIGFVDTSNRTYYKVVDYGKNQIFKAPKYRNAVGLSLDVIKVLKKLKVLNFRWTVAHFENECFDIAISLKEFLEKGQEVNFSGKNSDRQIILSINEWRKIPTTQTVLTR